MKLITKLKENYIYYNITILLLSAYVIFFPFISKILGKISPIFTTCVYLKTTGKQCPLCGGTRYIQNIGQVFNDVSYLFNFFGIVIIITIFELIFRTICILRIKKKKDMNKIIIFDIVFHTFIVIAYFIYEIKYILNN